jgi:two-component system phosphate regulon sensor histidine kinase PhoR
MWRSRMFWQLFVTYGGLVLFAISLLGLVVTGRALENELRQIEDGLRSKALLVREVIRGRTADQIPKMQPRLAALENEIQTRITLMTADGTALADSARDPGDVKNQGHYPEMQQAREKGYGTDKRVSVSVPGQPTMYFALRTDDPTVAYVRLALPLEVVDEQAGVLRRLVWTAGALTGILALALAFWLARRITRPIQELTEGAEQIAAGDYGHKVYAESGDEVGTLARSFNHMSERLAAQFAQLDEDRQQLRAVLSSMVEGVVALDAGQHILFANERAGRLLDFQTRTAVGRRLWEVVRQRPVQEVVEATLNGAGSLEQELRWDGPAGKSLLVHAGPLPGSPPRGAVLVLHDTSELRRLERLRHEFVANVSHELKTPLSVIKACIETLLDGAVDDVDHRGRFLEQIDHHADRLHNLILDLLSLARLDSGTETFAFQAVALEKVVAACVERRRPLVEGKHQQLEVTPPEPPGPVTAWADEEAVRQILDNLVDNAIKYTPEGGRIQVRWWQSDGRACLAVQDTGVGIGEHDLPRIFERFYRVDRARSREMGGTGLGLSIVKHLTQAMRGTVAAVSRLNEGSTFTVRLPVPAAEEEPGPAAGAEQAQPARSL